jgi:NOL1/NOP2/fmu family ribosome biogenesis protein
MFRKDEGAVSEWSPQNIERCATLQREIVADIWDNLKPGGLLVYSTCTFNTKENEENVQWIQQHYRAEILAVDTDEEWHIKGSLLPGFDEPVYRFLPGFTRGEGLFMAVLRKNWDNTVAPSKAVSPKPQRTPFDGQCRDWLPEGFTFVQEGDRLLAIPDNIATVWATARKSLKVLHAGITIGTIKGRNLIPDQSLALSAPLHRDAFPQADLDYETAIMYLRRESITLPSNTPLGFVLVTYRHIPLGFVKNIGNRANNLYPAEWKIKSTHMPLTIPAVLDINS